jgi:putative IMPACT (imprinted ancient) family translation regulator
MSAEMLVAIGGILAGLGGIISAFLLYRKTVALLEYRMERVEKKLDEHNGYGEKFGDIRTDIAVIKTDLSYLKAEVSKR